MAEAGDLSNLRKEYLQSFFAVDEPVIDNILWVLRRGQNAEAFLL